MHSDEAFIRAQSKYGMSIHRGIIQIHSDEAFIRAHSKYGMSKYS
jgi:hypothetical protein